MLDVSKAFEYVDNFSRTNNISSTLVQGIDKNKEVNITIAIPTYKRSKALWETINSAIKQTGFESNDYEILIVDNDCQRNCETEQLIKEQFSNQNNIRYYKNQENIGLFGNWNRCFELAAGKWVVLLHDDDFIYPDFLENTIPILEANSNIAILKPSMENWHDNNEKHVRKPTEIKYKSVLFKRVKALDYIFSGNYMGAPTGCVFRKENVINIGGFNLDLFPSADTMAILYIAMNEKVYLLRKTLGVQRVGQNESLKPETLKKFMISRFSTISFLIDKYKLNGLLSNKYKYYCLTKFEQEIQQGLSADFTFDFSTFAPDAHRVHQYFLAKIMQRVYNIYKKLYSALDLSVKQ